MTNQVSEGEKLLRKRIYDVCEFAKRSDNPHPVDQIMNMITTSRKEGAIEALEGLKETLVQDTTLPPIHYGQPFFNKIDQAIKTLREGE